MVNLMWSQRSLAVLTLLPGLLFLAAFVSPERASSLAVAPEKPNIIFVLTDDMRKDDLQFVPRTRELMFKGLEFENAFVSTSWCCPSRASYLTGEYPHNHNVRDNNVGPTEPNGVPGGFPAFRDDAEARNVGIFMRRAGYTTFYGGKYFNNYGLNGSASYVPPGWDSWHGRWPGCETDGPNPACWNDNGVISSMSEQGEDDDTMPDEVLGQKASSFVYEMQETGDPFFAVLSTLAPHREGGGEGATYKIDPEAKDLYADRLAPRNAAFNEADVSDKSSWIQNRERLSIDQKEAIDQQYRERARTLYSVDDMMEELYAALKESGELNNTHVFFTSDHGISLGAHRMPGKGHYFEQDIRVPLLASGPSVPYAATPRKQMILNTDFAPTFLDLAGAPVPTGMDGTSFAPLLERGSWGTEWRKRILVENERAYGRPQYDALRSETVKWVQLPPNGDRELYRIDKDPLELDSYHRRASQSRRDSLNEKLRALKKCAGEGCRTAEGFPKP